GTFNNISTVPGAVVGITGAVAVAARGYHSCALLGDGTVWCWGRNSDGQLGVTPSGSQCPTTPGFFCSSTPVRATGITSAAAVIAGGYHTCALFGDGTSKGRSGTGPPRARLPPCGWAESRAPSPSAPASCTPARSLRTVP